MSSEERYVYQMCYEWDNEKNIFGWVFPNELDYYTSIAFTIPYIPGDLDIEDYTYIFYGESYEKLEKFKLKKSGDLFLLIYSEKPPLKFSIGYNPFDPLFIYRKTFLPFRLYIGKYKKWLGRYQQFVQIIPLEISKMDMLYTTYNIVFVGLTPKYPKDIDFNNNF
ncbi:MAG: hypothetical protein ACFFAO_19680 [Candidatus Hermodarchaeota archaeon]